MDDKPDITADVAATAQDVAPPRDPYQERRDRWRRPLTSTYDRLRAWVNMIFVDHAFFRMVYLNLHALSPNAWRAAQPLPYQIHKMARRGVRSIITLRGGQSFGSYPLEVEACEKAGLHFETFELRSRAVPTIEQVEGAVELFNQLDYPVLFHCKSGADRAGMMSALYLALHMNVPVATARKQLSWKFGHIKQGKTGILDSFFDAYEADQPDGAMPLLEWVRTRYRPDELTEAYKSGKLGDFLTENLLGRE